MNRFEIVGPGKKDPLAKAPRPHSQSRSMEESPVLVLCVLALGFVLLIAMAGPFWSNYSFEETTPVYNQAPNKEFWFGTDHLGRDLLSRASQGVRMSLLISGAVTGINFLVAMFWGTLSGFLGGWVDRWMMGILNVLSGIPYLLLVLLVLMVWEPELGALILALSLTGWIPMARIVRAEVLSYKQAEYVLASACLGSNGWERLTKHIYPNLKGPLWVMVTYSLPRVIFTESFLSYIGLGIAPPNVSLGIMTAEGASAMLTSPWRLWIPALLIVCMIFAFNGLGDVLQGQESRDKSP